MREKSQLATAHAHVSPLSLALDLDELEEDRLLEIQEELSVCPSCLSGLEVLVYWLDALGHWDPRVGPEFVTRHRLMAELLHTDERDRQRLGRLRLDETYHNWGLCRLLLDTSREATPRSRSYSFHLAELTQTVAEALDASFYGSDWVADLRAETAAHLAVLNRQRRLADEAGRQFRLARECLEAGTGRAQITRIIQEAESLFSRDIAPVDAASVSRDTPQSLNLSSEGRDPRGPVHRLLESCRAARECV